MSANSYKEGKRIVSVAGYFIHETDKAEYIEFGNSQADNSVWLPKSQLAKTTELHNVKTGECTVYIPLWLAEKNFLNYEDIKELQLSEEDEADQDSYTRMMQGM